MSTSSDDPRFQPAGDRDRPGDQPGDRHDPTSPLPYAQPSYPAAPPPPSDPYRFGPPGPNPFGYPDPSRLAAHQQPGQPVPPAQFGAPQQQPYGTTSAYRGYPMAPAGSGYSAPHGTNGKAVAGLVLGIVAAVLFWLTLFDIPLIVLGIVFSALGLRAANRGGGGKGMAVTGLICSLVAVLAATIFFVWALNRSRSCSDRYDVGTSQYQNCIRLGN